MNVMLIIEFLLAKIDEMKVNIGEDRKGKMFGKKCMVWLGYEAKRFEKYLIVIIGTEGKVLYC